MILKELCCENMESTTNNDDKVEYIEETDTTIPTENNSYGGTIAGNICININNNTYEGDTYIYLDDLTLDLYRVNNLSELVKSVKTDKKGFYEFNDITIDDYIIKINLPPEYILCEKDSNSLLNENILISDKINNLNDVNIPIRLKRLFKIKGVIFLDKSKTSIYNKESIGVNGINVYLYDEYDNLVQETKSIKFLSMGGFFEFNNIEPKTYKITITTEEGINFSPPRYDLEFGSKASKNFSGIKCNISDHDLDSAYMGLIYNN